MFATKSEGRGRPKGGLLILLNVKFYKVETLHKNNSYIFISICIKKTNVKFILGLLYLNPSVINFDKLDSLNEIILNVTKITKIPQSL